MRDSYSRKKQVKLNDTDRKVLSNYNSEIFKENRMHDKKLDISEIKVR